jgi:MerR family transcriptional regulator, light-induced transcriptional regulator
VDDLLTTAEAAALVGTGASSIKRWADTGALPCVRTIGKHRRFRRSDVERLLEGAPIDDRALDPPEPTAAAPEPAAAWIDLLIATDSPHRVAARLLDERAARGSWHAVGDFLGGVLTAVGERWARGVLSVLDEHLASERLARALAHVATSMPSGADDPVCLLVGADGDEHTLGLSLLEPCLREAGWRARWAGRSTPTRDVIAAVDAGGVAMVAVSASLSADRRRLARQAAALVEACRAHRIDLVLGGSGPWPTGAGRRFRDLAGFHRFAADRAARRRLR